MRERHQLDKLRDSVERLHRPPPNADALALQQRTDPAWRRLMFDELLAQQLALRAAREARADALLLGAKRLHQHRAARSVAVY